MRKNIVKAKDHVRNWRQARRLTRTERVITESGYPVEVKLFASFDICDDNELDFLVVKVETDGIYYGDVVQCFEINRKGRREALQAFRNTIQKVKNSLSWINEFGNVCLVCNDDLYDVD